MGEGCSHQIPNDRDCLQRITSAPTDATIPLQPTGRGGDCGVFEITSAGEIAPLPLVQIFALNRGISLSPGTIKKGGGAEYACSESRTDLPSFPTIYGRR